MPANLVMEKTEGKYLYCVMRKPNKFTLELYGVGGGKIHCVASDNLAAVVSDAQVMDYPITRENTITHQRVIEEVMRTHSPVLPVSFSTVAENAKVIREKMLEAKETQLIDSLRDINGKVELNLKAIWFDMPKIFQKVVAENPEIERIKRELSGRTLSRDQAIEVGKLVESAVEARRENIKQQMLSLLEGVFADYKETSLLGEQMVFNLAFLIPEANQKTFDKIVRNLDEKYAEENIYFKYFGPIPPFNFVKVPISLT